MTTRKNNKPFQSLNKQLKILRNRGLNDVNSSAKRKLEQIGYYSLINGYKWPFLDTDSYGDYIQPEVFKPNTSFNDLYTLHEFDADLRSVLYKALLKYESILGAELSYRFSEAHPEEHSYLALDNFVRNPEKVSSVVNTISSLSGTISYKLTKKAGDNAIKHYVNNHGHVPLWVLTNFLTFGELSHFYSNCTDNVKLSIAKDFKLMRQRSYGNKKQSSITPQAIMDVNRMVNIFRNYIAHGEITYSKVLTKSPNLGDIKAAAGLSNTSFPNNSQAGIFELLIALKAVLPKKDYKDLIHNLYYLLKKYKNEFSNNYYKSLLETMHFPDNYKNLL